MFRNRRQAGYLLSKKLHLLEGLAAADQLPAVVYGLSPSSIPIAAEIALSFNCPLEPLFCVESSPSNDTVATRTNPKGLYAMIVDDGIDDFVQVESVVNLLMRQSAQKVIVVAPVVALEAYMKSKESLVDCVALLMPQKKKDSSEYFMSFDLVTDMEVPSILNDCNGNYLRSA